MVSVVYLVLLPLAAGVVLVRNRSLLSGGWWMEWMRWRTGFLICFFGGLVVFIAARRRAGNQLQLQQAVDSKQDIH